MCVYFPFYCFSGCVLVLCMVFLSFESCFVLGLLLFSLLFGDFLFMLGIFVFLQYLSCILCIGGMLSFFL